MLLPSEIVLSSSPFCRDRIFLVEDKPKTVVKGKHTVNYENCEEWDMLVMLKNAEVLY